MEPQDRSTLLDRPLGGDPEQTSAPPSGGPDRRGWIVAGLALAALAVVLLLWSRGGSRTAVLRASEPVLEFGTLGLGEERRLELELRNEGDRRVKLQRIEVTGNHPDDFEIAEDECTGRKLAGENGCRLTLAFRPSRPGAAETAAFDREGRTAALRVLSDATNGPVVVPLLGGRELPRLVPSHRSQDFGDHDAGDRPPPTALTFENQGAVAVALGPVSLEGEGATDFLRVLDSCSQARLDPGESCTVRVAFTPRTPGDSRARLLLPSEALARPLAVTLSGSMNAPRPVAAADEAPEGDEPEERAEPRPARSTPTPAKPTAATTATAAATDVRATTPSTRDDPVERRRSVEPTPPARDEPQTTVAQIPEEPDEPIEPMKTTVEPARRVIEVPPPPPKRPMLLIEPTRVDFGRVVGDRRVTGSVTLTNEGNAPLTLRGLRLDANPGFRLTEGDGPACRRGGVLAPGARCTLSLAFTAATSAPQDSAGEPRRGRLVVEHDGPPSSDDTVTLAALALPEPLPRLALSPGRLSFPEYPVGQRSSIEVLTVRNEGAARLELKDLRIEGPAAEDFRLVPATCDGAPFVAPGSDCTVGVRFAPTALGTRRARLVVESSARPGAAVVELGGRGMAPGR